MLGGFIMSTSKPLSRFLMTLVVIATGFISLVAQVRPTPSEFKAKVVAEPNAAAYVFLSWIGVTGDGQPAAYNIYMAAGQTEDETKFDKVGRVEVKPNDPPRENSYSFMVKDLKPGTYTFYVRGAWANDLGPRTPIKVLVIEDKTEAKIWFASSPVKTGHVSKPYSYEAKAKALVDGMIRYSLINAPEGMTINAETGLITWNEPRAGRYEITVKASIEAGGVVIFTKQSYVLEIGKGEDEPKHCATLTGDVKFEDPANTVVRGVVIAWRLDRATKDNGDTLETFSPVYKAEIKGGMYILEVPAGTYKLRVEGENFLAEWHENVGELADAMTVVAECNTRTVVNFTVTARPEPTIVVIKGRVFDALTKAGLKALVIFDARSKEDGGVDGRYRRLVAETNAEGNYEIRLQAGVNYVAYAKILGHDNKESDYLAEFWNDTHDASTATLINVTANEDGINFSMDKRPVFENGFSGMLKNTHTGAGVSGKVIAYLIHHKIKDSGDTLLDKHSVQTVETDANFGYRFTNLEPGIYIVFGVPSERPNVPGWMKFAGTAATEWHEATRIEVGEVMLTVEYDILLDTAKGERGKGRVRGWIYDKRGGIFNKEDNDGRVQNASAVTGSLVVARDEDGDIIDFALSENEGAFELTELSVGTITVTADRLDFDPTSQVITLDAANTDHQLSLGLVASVTGVEVPVDAVGGTVNLWPNPASANATVRFSSVTGSADIRILSMTGVVLATQNVNVNSGETSVVLNTNALPIGMVMVHVTNGTSTFALPLQIVR